MLRCPWSFQILILAAIAVLGPLHAAAQAGCTPNGNRFNLELLTNALGQFDESVAVLPGSGVGGADLVVGTALDTRALPPVGFVGDIMADAIYVQRDASDCGADL